MAAGTLPAVIGGANKNTLVIYDANGNVAASISLVNSSGVEILTMGNPGVVVERPYQGVVLMTLDQPQSAQRAVRINCTAAGNVSLTYADGSKDTIPVNVGLSYIAGAITTVNSSGTTATATYANMK